MFCREMDRQVKFCECLVVARVPGNNERPSTTKNTKYYEGFLDESGLKFSSVDLVVLVVNGSQIEPLRRSRGLKRAQFVKRADC
jgi:hypothetical protein